MQIYTDGACSGNPGPGGAGVVVVSNNTVLSEMSIPLGITTNNQAELSAFYTALTWVYDNLISDKVIIFTDSNYVQKGYTEWLPGWRSTGFKVKNPEFWIEISKLKDKLPNVSVQWVKAHNGDRWNEYADKLARKAR